jgi:hypothetical protein
MTGRRDEVYVVGAIPAERWDGDGSPIRLAAILRGACIGDARAPPIHAPQDEDFLWSSVCNNTQPVGRISEA